MARQTEFGHPPAGHVGILGYDPADDDWHAIYVDDNGRIQVDVAVAEPLDVRCYGWDGSAARKLSLLWGYSDRWLERVTEIGSPGGVRNLETVPVPAGYVYVAERIAMFTHNSTLWIASLQAGDGTSYILLGNDLNLEPYRSLGVSGHFTLKAGDRIRATFQDATVGDNLYLDVLGVKMRVNQ